VDLRPEYREQNLWEDFLAGRTRGLPLALVVVAAITFVLLLTWLASKR
jgi:hypothetical protein